MPTFRKLFAIRMVARSRLGRFSRFSKSSLTEFFLLFNSLMSNALSEKYAISAAEMAPFKSKRMKMMARAIIKLNVDKCIPGDPARRTDKLTGKQSSKVNDNWLQYKNMELQGIKNQARDFFRMEYLP